MLVASAALLPLFMSVQSLAAAPTSRPSASTLPAEASAMSRDLSNLANPDAEIREAGRNGLMRLRRQDLPELRNLVEKSRPLLPSQSAALQQIVREVYLADEKYEPDGRGFLGILMEPDAAAAAMRQDFVPDNDNPPKSLGVTVSDRIPGFCAARRLLDGDVILGTSRPFKPFHQSDDLKNVIGQIRPGAIVYLRVLRRGQVIEVQVTLDAHPSDTLREDNVPDFRLKREKKFEAYWRREFEPLVRRNIG